MTRIFWIICIAALAAVVLVFVMGRQVSAQSCVVKKADEVISELYQAAEKNGVEYWVKANKQESGSFIIFSYFPGVPFGFEISSDLQGCVFMKRIPG